MTAPSNPAVLRAEAASDRRLARIVRVLSDNSMLVVSGTKIGEEIGATRGEVWRLIQHLRFLGLDIAGHPATGYRLGAMPDLLLPDAISPLVKGTIFAGRIHHLFTTPSTNTVAMQAAASGEPDGAVFLAEEQTSGRGRGGHSWHSAPATGIYCSAILRPQLSPADALVLALSAGLATAAGVEEVTGLKPDLRWPNDLLLSRNASVETGLRSVPLSAPEQGSGTAQSPVGTQSVLPATRDPLTSSRKFAGILTELNAEATIVRHIVIGIGINVNQDSFPPDIAEIATSLRIEAGRTFSRVDLAAALLRHLDREYAAFKSGDPQQARAGIIRRFEQRSSYARGLHVRVEEEGGYEGITDGLDDLGFLRVRSDKGTRTVLHGGVRALTDADADHF
jgi:BirA family transcriptional regulator, biotin operon repressor / biotin---[acetyl-CoA-carboxylase] ligase